MNKVSVVVPNLNGGSDLLECLESLASQTLEPRIILVDNASHDGSAESALKQFPQIELIRNYTNRGFAGGVNVGIKRAIERGDDFVALLNDDAIADKDWLKNLAACLEKTPKAGIATSKILSGNGKFLDSTGEFYTNWGLPYPRGRGETDLNKYDNQREIFGASGGASLYRVKMLEQVGLFDEDFFAYYEDVDLSFRAQLAGWKVLFEPSAIVYHQIGATSGRMPGFATYQTLKNLPMLYVKNMPTRLFWRNALRFKLVYWSIFFSSVAQGNGWPALKGLAKSLLLLPKKLVQRAKIQRSKKLSTAQVSVLLIHDLPPNANKLRKLRSIWRKFIGKSR